MTPLLTHWSYCNPALSHRYDTRISVIPYWRMAFGMRTPAFIGNNVCSIRGVVLVEVCVWSSEVHGVLTFAFICRHVQYITRVTRRTYFWWWTVITIWKRTVHWKQNQKQQSKPTDTVDKMKYILCQSETLNCHIYTYGFHDNAHRNWICMKYEYKTFFKIRDKYFHNGILCMYCLIM